MYFSSANPARLYSARSGIRGGGSAWPVAVLILLLHSVPHAWALSDRDTPIPAPEMLYFHCDQGRHSDRNLIDMAREGLSEWLCEANLWVDGMLGGVADVQAARQSHGRLSVALGFSERESWDFNLRLRVRVNLPNWEDRLSAFVGREPDNDFVSGRSEGLALREEFPVLDDEEQWLAGLGYRLPTGYRIRSSFDVGARSLDDPEIFLRQRILWNITTGNTHLVNLRLIPFWTNKDDLGVTFGLDAAVTTSETTLLRWDYVGTKSGVTESVDWRGAMVLYQSLGTATGIALEFYATGDTGRAESMREYGMRTIYRCPLIPRELFLLASVGNGWFREPDGSSLRKRFFNANLVLDMPFGL